MPLSSQERDDLPEPLAVGGGDSRVGEDGRELADGTVQGAELGQRLWQLTARYQERVGLLTGEFQGRCQRQDGGPAGWLPLTALQPAQVAEVEPHLPP